MALKAQASALSAIINAYRKEFTTRASTVWLLCQLRFTMNSSLLVTSCLAVRGVACSSGSLPYEHTHSGGGGKISQVSSKKSQTMAIWR